MRKSGRTVVIGGGTLRGRVLQYPDAAALRPSMQRTKASVFSSLAGEIDGAVFADLFAGAGGVGIEAYSRGARAVHFVEFDRAALDALRGNLAALGVEARVHAERVAHVLDARPCALADADVVWADPPYDADVNDELMRRLDVTAMPALRRLVVEHRTRVVLDVPAGMRFDRARRFGDTTVSYFAR